MMERFKKIKWNPSLESIINDNVFIKDERMEKESSMYKHIIDTFLDPFADIEQDYADVNVELLKCLNEDNDTSDETEQDEQETSCENDEDSTNKEQTYMKKKRKNTENNQQNVQKQEKNIYIPGLRKLPFYFPRYSNLDRNQQKIYLRVILKLFSNQKKSLTAEERTELESYMTLQNIISEEQSEFLDFVKTKWDTTIKWPIKCDEYILLKWKAKLKKLQELPRYFVESMIIPFSSDKTVTLSYISCLQQGSFSKIKLPKFEQPYYTNILSSALLAKFPINKKPDKMMQHFKLPVSKDTFCEELAKKTEADLVISSSGLKCLLSNFSNNSTAWIIPIVIKSHNGKNVIYIDKKLPPTFATAPQKNTWVYKYILRFFFSSDENDKSSEKMTYVKEDQPKTEVLSDDECTESFDEYLKVFEENLYMTDSEDNSEETKSTMLEFEGQNITYKLFTMTSAESNQYEPKKETTKQYQILVRTKIDGIELLSDERSQHLILAPKMEHQIAIGAEAITLKEGLEQWASLIFRPETSLARVRIASESGEIIQIEKHTAITLSNEIKRLHNVKVTDLLKILYNVIEKLSSLMPGEYIMRHTASNGPFISIYKEGCGKTAFDLHAAYKVETFQTIPTPWPSIDPMIVTPALKFFNRIPATFSPAKFGTSQLLNKTQKLSKVKGCLKKNQQLSVTSPVRRSLRKKKLNKK